MPDRTRARGLFDKMTQLPVGDPTLSVWGVVVLAGLLALAALGVLRG